MPETAPSPAPADIAIIGAGPAGATLALACARGGLTTVLVDGRDRKAERARDTRNYAIVRGSWRLLDALGVAGALLAHAEPLNGLEAEDGGTHLFGPPAVLFGNDDLPETGRTDLPLGYMVEAERLQAALDEAVAASGAITVHAGVRFEGLDVLPGHARISLSDGLTLSAALVAGCDGVNSAVRAAAGIATEGRDYGKSVLAANVRLAEPHGGIARQLFTPEGPFATLPLPGQRANLAWYMARGAAEALAARGEAAVEAELNARFSGFAGAMTLDGPVLTYPLRLQLARSMIAERVALVGDAARRINPLAGQGLNLGFKDAAALAEVAVDAVQCGLDPGSSATLERYQRWRRFDAMTTALFMDGVDRVFSNDNPALKPLRTAALLAADRLGPLRRAMARQASADRPGLPRLMRP